MKSVGIGIAALVGLLALTWIVQGNEFFLFSVFAPRVEAVRRQTFEQTKSYRQGMAQDLDRWYVEYQSADATHKEAIASVVRHRLADFDESDLPPYLATWVREIRRGR